jgi:hypothetical protein
LPSPGIHLVFVWLSWAAVLLPLPHPLPFLQASIVLKWHTRGCRLGPELDEEASQDLKQALNAFMEWLSSADDDEEEETEGQQRLDEDKEANASRY